MTDDFISYFYNHNEQAFLGLWLFHWFDPADF